MNRRSFLTQASLLSLGLLLPGASGWAFSNGNPDPKAKRLVVVLLRGAVDGLNVVIPYGDSRYYQVRHSIAIARPGQDAGALDLDGRFGLHPSLMPLMPFWQQGSLGFVHAAGSPDPTRSHFDAQDYMESGAPGNKVISTGWMNRLLAQMPENHSPIRALNFGPTMPRIFSGPAPVANIEVSARSGKKSALDRPAVAQAFQELYNDPKDPISKAFQEGMDAKRTISQDLEEEMVMANGGAPLPNNIPSFGKQLAKLMTKDPSVQLAFLAFGGWDTHVNQGAGRGQLANRLKPLGQGLADLANGLGPLFDNTTIMLMSEFGRTARENGNGGTDHGHGNAIWVLGGKVHGQKVYGKFNGLGSSDLYEARDVPVLTDFRSVVASVLEQHMGLASAGISKVFPQFSPSLSGIDGILKA